MSTLGASIMDKLEAASRHSASGPGVTRTFCSGHHKAVVALIQGWMEDAGLTVRLDDSGNLVGRRSAADETAATLIMGSHQDTVVSGGKYDGMLGVVLPIVCMKHLYDRGIELPYAVDVVAFGDEEGARFQSTLVGSRALAGTFDPAMLSATDSDGITMGEALRAFGCEPSNIPTLARDPVRTLAFLEVHIEQGPVLEDAALPVGVVTSITGIERHRVTLAGKAGHAGTVPMELRRDALVAAAEAIQIVDRTCRETENLVGVVGKIANRPNAVNVIPSEVEFTVELRSPDAGIRQRAREGLLAELATAARTRGIAIDVERTYEADGIECAPWMIEALAKAVQACGHPVRTLFSGAGHDGLAMDDLTDVGMLFVRCRDGLSHHPDESITAEDAEAAAEVLIRFLRDLA